MLDDAIRLCARTLSCLSAARFPEQYPKTSKVSTAAATTLKFVLEAAAGAHGKTSFTSIEFQIAARPRRSQFSIGQTNEILFSKQLQSERRKTVFQ